MILVRPIVFVVLLTFCAFYAYLPGEYDALAVPLSVVAQAVAVSATAFITPVGAAWLLHRAVAGASRRHGTASPAPDRRYLEAAALAAGGVAVFASLVAWGSGGRAFGALTLTLAALTLARVRPGVTREAHALTRGAHAAAGGASIAAALAATPVLALLLQLLLAEPMAAYSRTRAIVSGASLISDIERYHATHGSYPESLNGAWADYKVSVVGIEQYHYAKRGEAYNLHFEQPVPQILILGTREFVVYNPRGQHLMLSHAAWHLSRSSSDLDLRQGWYDAHYAAHPGWKRFLFD